MKLVQIGNTWVNPSAVVKVSPASGTAHMCARSVITLVDGSYLNCGEDPAYVADMFDDTINIDGGATAFPTFKDVVV